MIFGANSAESFSGCLIYHPVCASKEGGLFLYGAATPPVQEGKFAGRHIFLRITRTPLSPGSSSPHRTPKAIPPAKAGG